MNDRSHFRDGGTTTQRNSIQFKSTLFLFFGFFLVGGGFYFNGSIMNRNNKWCFRSWSGGPWCAVMGTDVCCEGHWALPFLAWGQHGIEGGWPAAAFWIEVKSFRFHSDSGLGQITVSPFSPLQTARNDLNEAISELLWACFSVCSSTSICWAPSVWISEDMNWDTVPVLWELAAYWKDREVRLTGLQYGWYHDIKSSGLHLFCTHTHHVPATAPIPTVVSWLGVILILI